MEHRRHRQKARCRARHASQARRAYSGPPAEEKALHAPVIAKSQHWRTDYLDIRKTTTPDGTARVVLIFELELLPALLAHLQSFKP